MQTLTFKVSDEEARFIRRQARLARVTLSEYLRRRAAATAPRSATAPRMIRCALTGATIFAPPAQSTPLTTEAVRELLSDFP